MPASRLPSDPQRSGFSCWVSWARSRAGDRQSIAHVRQVILEIAIFFVLRTERNAADLAVAGGETSADRAHAAPFGAIDRHRVENAQCGRQYLGAYPLARLLHMAGGAGEIELPAPRIEIFLALLISLERARIVGNLDVKRLAARGESHIGGQRGHLVFDIREWKFAIGLTAAIQRQLQGYDLAFPLVEIRIVLADADALIGKAIAVGLAVLERRRKHLLAGLERSEEHTSEL